MSTIVPGAAVQRYWTSTIVWTYEGVPMQGIGRINTARQTTHNVTAHAIDANHNVAGNILSVHKVLSSSAVWKPEWPWPNTSRKRGGGLRIGAGFRASAGEPNWPQAAISSSPRESRTVHSLPESRTICRNTWTTSISDASNLVPPCGLNSIKLTEQYTSFRRLPSLSASSGLSLMPLSITYLNTYAQMLHTQRRVRFFSTS